MNASQTTRELTVTTSTCICSIIRIHRDAKPLVPGEYSNGKALSTNIDDDDFDPYGDDPDANMEEKPSVAAPQAGAANGGETGMEGGEEMQEDEEEGEEEEDEDDEDDGLDIVVTAPQRSMDFR